MKLNRLTIADKKYFHLFKNYSFIDSKPFYYFISIFNTSFNTSFHCQFKKEIYHLINRQITDKKQMNVNKKLFAFPSDFQKIK